MTGSTAAMDMMDIMLKTGGRGDARAVEETVRGIRPADTETSETDRPESACHVALSKMRGSHWAAEATLYISQINLSRLRSIDYERYYTAVLQGKC